MLSTAADVAQLAQAAPWLAVGALALVAAAWVYRQSRRAVAAVQASCDLSAMRQGKRLGQLEKAVGMLDLRRRQVEWTLLDLGIELPYWPADGPDQPHPRPRPRRDDDQADDRADELGPDELSPETQARRIPVPPLDPAVAARHRRV